MMMVQGGGADYSKMYFTTEALYDNTDFFPSVQGLQYSLDKGRTWNQYSTTISVNAGAAICWKANNTTSTSDGIGTFYAGKDFDVYGNIMSLCYGDNYQDVTSIPATYLFRELLYYDPAAGGCVVDASNLILPATSLQQYCYYSMFNGCIRMSAAPELPATSLSRHCYREMFRGCTSLTKAPSILPAATLAGYCYYGMFYGCSALVDAPEIRATTLGDYCCRIMFQDCTSLVKAPELLAATVPTYGYEYMFNGCTKLNYIKCLATNISASRAVNGWVQNVASSGTFVKAASMSSWTTGVNGIPSGWTVQNA